MARNNPDYDIATDLTLAHNLANPARRDAAVEALWQKYHRRIKAMITSHLTQRLQGKVSPDSVEQEAWRSLFSESEAGRAEVHDSDGVFPLLWDIARKKLISHVRRESAPKRGAGCVEKLPEDDLAANAIQPISQLIDPHSHLRAMHLARGPAPDRDGPESVADRLQRLLVDLGLMGAATRRSAQVGRLRLVRRVPSGDHRIGLPHDDFGRLHDPQHPHLTVQRERQQRVQHVQHDVRDPKWNGELASTVQGRQLGRDGILSIGCPNRANDKPPDGHATIGRFLFPLRRPGVLGCKWIAGIVDCTPVLMPDAAKTPPRALAAT